MENSILSYGVPVNTITTGVRFPRFLYTIPMKIKTNFITTKSSIIPYHNIRYYTQDLSIFNDSTKSKIDAKGCIKKHYTTYKDDISIRDPTKKIDIEFQKKPNLYKPIDINNWDRRELYNHFSRLKLPHYSVAAYVDVTNLLTFKKREGLSFYLSLIYLTTKILNSIENFRLRIVDGKVVSYDIIHTNFTHKQPEEQVFRFHTAALEGTLHEYVEATSKAIAKQTTLFGGMGDIQNVVYCSCVPTLDATSVLNPGMENPEDAIPRVNWGKYVEKLEDGDQKSGIRNKRWMINITVTVNHRFIDGYHIGLFFERLQKAINQL